MSRFCHYRSLGAHDWQSPAPRFSLILRHVHDGTHGLSPLHHDGCAHRDARRHSRRVHPAPTLVGGPRDGCHRPALAAFALSTRGISQTSLTTVDVALIRFATPVLLLAWRVPRALRELRVERGRTVPLLLIGGLPYLFIYALGAHLTSAGLSGMIVPWTAPVFVSLIAWALWRDRISTAQLVALVAILLGVAVSATQVSTLAGLVGLAVLVGAGLTWAVYTIGLRSSSLSPLSLVLVVSSSGAIGAAALALTGAMPSNLLAGTGRLTDALTFLSVQGIGAALLSTLSYTVAVRELGSAKAASAGAASPALTVGAAYLLFGEPITGGLLTALIFIVTGVLLFNRPPALRLPQALRLQRTLRLSRSALRSRPDCAPCTSAA